MPCTVVGIAREDRKGTHCILDDILITGFDDEHHLAHVKAVLQPLEGAGLRANR